LQGTFCIPSKATKLVGQVKAKEKVQSLDFQAISTRFQLFHKAKTLTKSPVALDGTSGFGFRRIGLGGGRLTEAQKPLKKKNCLSVNRLSFGSGLWYSTGEKPS
jgi:hypothetical protein